MNALVVGAAPVPGHDAFYRGLLAGAGLLIAADAAGEWCVSLGRSPDAVVGDFDSSAPGAAQRLEALGVPVETHPAEKDDSDLDLAVLAARRLGATTVTLTAVASERLDHTLAALGTLVRAADLASELSEPDLAAWSVDGIARPRLDLVGRRGATVSVFSVRGEATGVTLDGFAYPLHDATLQPLSGMGLSNTLAQGRAFVRVGAGALIVLAPGEPGERPTAL